MARSQISSAVSREASASQLWFFFGQAVVALLFGRVVFPHVPFNALAPFFAKLYTKVSFEKAVWISFGCGVCVDLVSSEFHYGVHMASFCVTTAVLFHRRKYVVDDHPFTFFLSTTLISSMIMLTTLILASCLGRGVPLHWKGVVAQLLLFPLLDGVYGYVWFTYPLRAYDALRQRMPLLRERWGAWLRRGVE